MYEVPEAARPFAEDPLIQSHGFMPFELRG